MAEFRFYSTLQLHIQSFSFEFEYLELYLIRWKISEIYKNRQKDSAMFVEIAQTKDTSLDIIRLPTEISAEPAEFNIMKSSSICFSQMMILE